MRVAIYLRCAYPDRTDFEEQRNRCLAYSAQAGHDVVAVYEDFGQSGMKNDRPGLQAMLTAAETGTFEAIVADRLYRLSRDTSHLVNYLEQLTNHKVSLVVVENGSGNDGKSNPANISLDAAGREQIIRLIEEAYDEELGRTIPRRHDPGV